MESVNSEIWAELMTRIRMGKATPRHPERGQRAEEWSFCHYFTPILEPSGLTPGASAGFWKPLLLFAAQPVPCLSWSHSSSVSLCLSFSSLQIFRGTGAPLGQRAAVTVTPLISNSAIFSEPVSSKARSGEGLGKAVVWGLMPTLLVLLLIPRRRKSPKTRLHSPAMLGCVLGLRTGTQNTPSPGDTYPEQVQKH